jgi:two-component system OmpR family sensor kinase/two-component system phosphate regulon sensor histidine kinase PhoR
MKILFSYSRRWLFYIVSFLLLFTAVLLVSEYRHERNFRIEALDTELDNYTVLVNNYVNRYKLVSTGNFDRMDSLNDLISKKSLRITIIAADGRVRYDSWVKDPSGMENHLQRPEIQKAIAGVYGTDIRKSHTTRIEYYYYARKFNNGFIRVSEVYDFSVKKFIQPDRLFILFVLLIFFITSFTIIIINDKFGKSIRTLRQFTRKALANEDMDKEIVFPGNELGVIGQEIIDIYKRLNKTKEELLAEKSKLIRHLNMLDEGIAIFSREKTTITSNTHFISFLNQVSDIRVISGEEFFRIDDFASLVIFIDKNLKKESMDLTGPLPTYEIVINKNGKIFSVKCVVFQDKTFEVSINDITKPAKRKLLKQQITENIAHELKTPVSSIKGFLETILQGNTDKAKTKDFLQRAYIQSSRLADLINDISLLTKIEEASGLYQVEMVDIPLLINDISRELELQFKENNISLELVLPGNISIKGNPVLLYSIFRNLFDNTIRHGGNNLTVRVDQYLEDKEFYYFSYSDTGAGVPADDLPRLFERFYRVDKGRDRKSGGTGLGLSIVKNAVQFHKGEISVRNRTGGGLEFLFTLSRELMVEPSSPVIK